MLLKLSRLRKNSVFMSHLRWDVVPQKIFQPRFIKPGEDRCNLINETQGFMFYIDYMKDMRPNLMVMKTYNLTSKTVGEVPEVPEDLLRGAVQKEGVRDIAGMYPIDEALEGWLRKELGVASY
jgi:hypothetical protein